MTDEQVAELRDAITGFPIGSGCYGTAIGMDEALDLAEDIALLIEQWIADALTTGDLPEGWQRREEGCFSTFRRTGMCHSKCPGGSLCCCPRTIITGPSEVSGDE